jgi:2-polyprenyl-6-hydroxyphenyl methylase/3-demethylubiquinone-9 3-methyltransferase
MDLCLVDGAHDLVHVQNDIIKVAQMVTDEGTVFWHDYGGKAAMRPPTEYLNTLGKKAQIFRVPDTSFAWAHGRELKRAVAQCERSTWAISATCKTLPQFRNQHYPAMCQDLRMREDKSLIMEHAEEVHSGQRFDFGRNWSQFLQSLTEEQIARAVESLQQMLGVESLQRRSFLDIGSGSGLFSLAARRLGARVHSFDYDPYSCASTAELRRRYFPEDEQWRVEQGSVLDKAYLDRLGQFDIVYSWGVLHHTGAMWQALENVARPVRPGGTLFIAIYNDQGKRSRRWRWVKKTYNALPPPLRSLVLGPAFVQMLWKQLLKDALKCRPLQSFRGYKARRGMSLWHDVVDWVGGYPFEVAKPEQIFDFYFQRGFQLVRLTTQAGDLGCNEFIFTKR